jgi:stage II sporulation protein D
LGQVHTGTIGSWPRTDRSPIVDPVLTRQVFRAARRSNVSVVSSALAAAALLFALTGTSALGATTLAAACDGVNLRTGASTSYTIKTSISTGTTIAAVATVSGGSWSTVCAGKAVAGSSWYRISAVNGKSVSTLYGVTYLYGATGLFKALTVNPTTSPTPTPVPGSTTGPTTLAASITFYGRGYGHGVGMSQYGANGRAAAGQNDATILAHYYQGSTLGTMTNAQIRVLVLSNWAATSTLQLYGRGGTWTFDGNATVFPADAWVRVIPTVTTTSTGSTVAWRLLVTAVGGAKLYDALTTGFRMRPTSSATTLQLYSKPSSYDRYRGVLRVIPRTTATVINELPIESYLRGVVPTEMPSAWPTEALKAQAIASRSYAARRLHPTTGWDDIYDDTRSQVYRGVLAEKSTTNAAIAATAGQVLKYGTSIANTLYHSTGGGATESNQNVFVSSTGAIVSSPVPYLQGSSDRLPDGTSYDAASPLATWHTATYTLAQIQAFFAADSRTSVGTLVALDLSHRGVSGRLISVTLIGADRTTKTVSGDIFVAVFNAHRPATDPLIRSSLLDFAPIP